MRAQCVSRALLGALHNFVHGASAQLCFQAWSSFSLMHAITHSLQHVGTAWHKQEISRPRDTTTGRWRDPVAAPCVVAGGVLGQRCCAHRTSSKLVPPHQAPLTADVNSAVITVTFGAPILVTSAFHGLRYVPQHASTHCLPRSTPGLTAGHPRSICVIACSQHQ